MSYFAVVLISITMLAFPAETRAEIKIVEAESSYSFGDSDSKLEARRVVTQEAKRKALEMAGTYLESLTEIRNMELSRDEVRAYTAGVVETEIVKEEMRGTAEHPEIYILVRCRIDSGVLVSQLSKLRDNEMLRAQLELAQKENEELKKERDGILIQIAAEKDNSAKDVFRKKLDAVMVKEDANDEMKKLARTVVFSEQDVNMSTEESEKRLSVIARETPRNAFAHILLAQIYGKRGDRKRAEQQLHTELSYNPEQPQLHLALGKLYRTDRRNRDAIAEFNAVERQMPNNPEMLFQKGMVLADMNDCTHAIKYLEKFIESRKRSEGMRIVAMRTIKKCEKAGRTDRRR